MSDFSLAVQTAQHPGDLLIVVAPVLPRRLVDITEVQAIARPEPHLVGRAQRDRQIALEFGLGLRLLGEALDDVGTDRFRGPPNLVGKRPLFDVGKGKGGTVHLQGQAIGPLKHLKALERDRCGLLIVLILSFTDI